MTMSEYDEGLPTAADVVQSLQLPLLIGPASFAGEELEWPSNDEGWARGFGYTEDGVQFGFTVSASTPQPIGDRDDVRPPVMAEDALRSLRAWVADHAGETIDRQVLKRQIDDRINALP